MIKYIRKNQYWLYIGWDWRLPMIGLYIGYSNITIHLLFFKLSFGYPRNLKSKEKII